MHAIPFNVKKTANIQNFIQTRRRSSLMATKLR